MMKISVSSGNLQWLASFQAASTFCDAGLKGCKRILKSGVRSTAWGSTIVPKDETFVDCKPYGVHHPRCCGLVCRIPALKPFSRNSVEPRSADDDHVSSSGTQHFTAELPEAAQPDAASAPPLTTATSQLRIKSASAVRLLAHGSGNAQGHRNGSVRRRISSDGRTRPIQALVRSSRWAKAIGASCSVHPCTRGFFEAREVHSGMRIPENQLIPRFS